MNLLWLQEVYTAENKLLFYRKQLDYSSSLTTWFKECTTWRLIGRPVKSTQVQCKFSQS